MPGSYHILPRKVIWARRGFWARFASPVEEAFRRHYEDDLVQRARWSAVVAASVMVIYAGLDVLMAPPDMLVPFLWLRGLFMIVPLLCIWWFSYTRFAARHLQKVAAAASTSSGLAVVAMVALAQSGGTPIAYEGMILTIFYFYCCGGLRLQWSALAGWVAAISYPIAEYFAGLGQQDIMVRILFLVSANVVGVISAGLMELSARRNFAQLIKLETMSHSDPLTGLLNRRALDSRLRALWTQAARSGQSLQIAMIDVDYFKAYNDHYGHAGGDQALREIATLLARHGNMPADITARYGGEEFLCLWPGSPDLPLSVRLGDILRDVERLALPHDKSPLGRLSLSIGAVELFPGELAATKLPEDAALRQADALLYRAKSQGRNQAVMAQSGTAEPRTIFTESLAAA